MCGEVTLCKEKEVTSSHTLVKLTREPTTGPSGESVGHVAISHPRSVLLCVTSLDIIEEPRGWQYVIIID